MSALFTKKTSKVQLKNQKKGHLFRHSWKSIFLGWQSACPKDRQSCFCGIVLDQTNGTNKQTIKQTKKDLKPHKCSKTKKGASSLALLKIDLPWMTVCMPQKTDVAVSVALPMNFAFFYDATIMTFWGFEHTIDTANTTWTFKSVSIILSFGRLGLIKAVHVMLNFDENKAGFS